MADSENNVEDDAGEDVESNFFDDFDKDEFMEGLEVIDSFNEKDEENEPQVHQKSDRTSPITKDVNASSQRRDLEKTNAAIRKDKEAKVKEHIAKHLESKDDLRPPGTELDDFFDQVRPSKSQKECPKYEHEDSESLPPKKHEDLNSPRWRSPVRREHSGNRDVHHSSGHISRKMHEYDSRYSNSYKNSNRHDSNYGSRYSPQGNSRNMLQRRYGNKYHHNRNYNTPPRSRHSPYHNSWRHSHHSPVKSPRHNWHQNLRRSPHYGRRMSPRYSSRHSPRHSPQHSPRYSPQRHVMRHSPHGPKWSPRRHSRQSPNYRRSNSPRKSRRSISHSPRRNSYDSDMEHHKHKTESQVQWSSEQNSSFVLNQNSQYDVHNHSQQFIPQQFNTEVSQMNASYVYPFTGEYNNYLAPSGAPANPIIAQDPNMLLTQPGPPDMSIPQSAPMPINPVPPVTIDQNILHSNFMAPQVPMVPHPSTVSSDPSTFQTPLHVENVKAPYDALAQLVAEGKLSQEDFVKLAPNTNGAKNTVDERTKKVLNRCKQAVQKLSTTANRLVIKHDVNTEILSSPQKFCSPLKRQVPVDFDYTSPGIQKNIHNKLILNKIVSATIGLEKGTLSEKLSKDVRSIGVQTTVPYCDMCEMRDSTKSRDIGVSTDSGVFSSTVHTQVVEEDLLNSKAIFNPSGSVVGSAPFSIAHLTPAQLVSQLAARAKTLQQADPASPSHQYRRRNTSNDYDGRGDAHYFNQNRYRY